jgi:hypothetical protein
MNEKPRRSWLLPAVINSVAVGMILRILQPPYIVKVAGAVVGFGPIVLALWLETRSGRMTKAQFATMAGLIVLLIVLIALWAD